MEFEADPHSSTASMMIRELRKKKKKRILKSISQVEQTTGTNYYGRLHIG